MESNTDADSVHSFWLSGLMDHLSCSTFGNINSLICSDEALSTTHGSHIKLQCWIVCIGHNYQSCIGLDSVHHLIWTRVKMFNIYCFWNSMNGTPSRTDNYLDLKRWLCCLSVYLTIYVYLSLWNLGYFARQILFTRFKIVFYPDWHWQFMVACCWV